MKYSYILITLLVVAFAAYKKSQRPQIPKIYFNTLESKSEIDSCVEKKDCLLVYVAPWCPACHNFISFYKEHANLFLQKEIGLVFVVGADEDRNKEIELKNSLGNVAVLDTPQQTFRKMYKINSFPMAFLIDKSGNVRLQESKALEYVNNRLNEM